MDDEEPVVADKLPLHVRRHFRDDLKEARAVALRDAEGFQQILFAIERLGAYMWERARPGDLKKYRDEIAKLAEGAGTVSYTTDEFNATYDLVRGARNDALHQGAFARHLTANAVKLALMVEEALMSGAQSVRDFMVRNPLCAERWQPLSLVRQAMLANSYSYLPLREGPDGEGKWALISDFELATYLRRGEHRAKQTLKEAENNGLSLIRTEPVTESTPITDALRCCSNGRPVVVVAEETERLVGILTPFDLL